MLARLTATTVCVLMLAGTAEAQRRGAAPAQQRGAAQAQQRDYPEVYRYTVKFFCDDLPDHLLHKGNYRTAISIHNPDFYAAEASIQASTINPLKPEERPVNHSKKTIEVGAHAVQLMACQEIKSALIDPAKENNTNPFKIGLIHVTSDRRLDVTTVYSVAAKGDELSSSFSMGEVTRQRIRACDKNKRIPLGDYANWVIESEDRAVPLSPRRARSGRELAPGHGWMAYKGAGNTSSEYIYRLRYCVCSGSGKLDGSVTVRSEGSSVGTLHAVTAAKSQKDDKASKIDELWDMKGQGNAFPNSRETPIKNAKFSDVGDGWIEVRISSGPGSSAISFTGDLVLDDGHPGYCQPPRY